MESRFEGKVAVVTGAARGIGRATALRFAAEGASVALVDIDESAVSEVAAEAAGNGSEVLAVVGDVADAATARRYVDEALQRFGRIDCFFNNAGVLGAVGPLLDYDDDVFDRVLATNVRGVWLGLKAVGAAMRDQGGGAIVNTASRASLGATPRYAPYGASKHAVAGLTKTAALEFAGFGIRVNAVAPGPIETAMIETLESARNPADPAAARDEMTAQNPLGRYGSADEVAALVAYLCSDEASFINGAVVSIDGGASAR